MIRNMESISSASAAMLRLETATAHMHVGWLARLDADATGPLDVPALRERIAARLAGGPRFRQVVGPGSGRPGKLVWRDDPEFSLDRHVLVWNGATTGEEELRVVTDRFLSEQLPRDRPLWSVLVLPHARGTGAAIVGKVHRALVDGQEAGMLERLVFDATAGEGRRAPDGERRREAELLDEYRAMRRLGTLAERQRDGGIAETVRRSALVSRRTEGTLASARRSFLNGPTGDRRTLVTARVDLGRLGRISRHTGTQLHDVVLALSAGTLRRVAIASGATPEDLRALVPLDGTEDLLFGDGACTVLDLPVAERRAAARLASVHASMTAARRPRRVPGEPVPTVLAGPPEELAIRLAMSSRVANVTIASSRGPERGHFVGGTRVRSLFPVMPMPDDHALALSTTTYDRHLHVAAIADPAALGGLTRLPIMLADAVEELALSTGARGVSYAPLPRRPTRPPARRRPPLRSS